MPKESCRKDLAQMEFLRPLLAEVRVQQKEYGREHAFKGSTKGTSCAKPKMDINDTEVMQLLGPDQPLTCRNKSNWIETKNGNVILKRYVAAGNSTIRCRIEPFEFVSDFATRTLESYQVTNNASVPTDFFRTECTAADGSNYTNYHATIVTEGKLGRKVERLVGFDRPLNIYFLGLDSLSRLMFMRKLKKTYEYITEALNATVHEMYNIVGDGTPAALLPIITGKTVEELPETRISERNASFVDVYPFIWKEVKEMGYVTLYAEDMHSIGTYTYRLMGFQEQPSYYYLRTFYRKVGTDTKVMYQLRISAPGSAFLCRRFFTAYPCEQPKFAFQFHSLYGHGYDGDLNLVELADGPTVKHLQFFQRQQF